MNGSFPGTGNLNVNPSFETNGTLRLLAPSPCIDQGTTNSLPGLRWVTRRDMDGEARLDHGAFANPQSLVDIGADEFVYRLQFPTVLTTNFVATNSGAFLPTGGWTNGPSQG